MNQRLRTFLLWIGVPLSLILAITSLGAFWPGIYSQEKSAADGISSDLIDLFLVLPLLVLSTVFAMRGSLRAALVWTGTLGYLSYNFIIYVFEVHFNSMFPAYCAVLGLSFYGLITALQWLSPDEVTKAFGPGAPRKSMAAAFLFVAVTAAARELKDIVSAILSGQRPSSIVQSEQFTDPIHVLDLCFLLPALAIAAVLLLRRQEKGLVLAPVLSVILILISIEVFTMIVRNGLANGLAPAMTFATVGTVMTALLLWYFRPR